MILFVDDEKAYMEHYLEELKLSGYDLSFQTDVDAALEFFAANHEQIDLLILDVMMPPGNSFEDKDIKKGLRTGIFFYSRIRQDAPALPIIMFTNVSDESAAKSFVDDKRCWFYQKIDLLPFELAEKVKEILQG